MYFLDIGNSTSSLFTSTPLKKVKIVETCHVMADPGCLLEDRHGKIVVASVVPVINKKLKEYYNDLLIIDYTDMFLKMAVSLITN